MAKMAVSVVVLALSLYASFFVRLGDLTFREHLKRIAATPEVHQLGEGIATTLGSAKSAVKAKIAARMHATREADLNQARPSDVDSDEGLRAR